MGKRNGMKALRSARVKVASRCSASGLAALLCSMGMMLAVGCNVAGQGGPSSDDADSAAARKRTAAVDEALATPLVGFALTEFFVDPPEANPANPHEVLGSPFTKCRLHILGQFDQSLCYQIRIKRSNVYGGTYLSCGSAGASGRVDVPSVDPNDGFENRFISDTEIFVQVRANASSNFKASDNWVIEVDERPNANCSGSPTELTWPLDEPTADPSEYLIIAPCEAWECETNQDCDDGLFCNGNETCDTDHVCQPGASPYEDEGLFCNGEESCDE